MTDVLELFGQPTSGKVDWQSVVRRQDCPYLGKKCIKVRKSQPEVSIGTCSVTHGRNKQPMLICPFRLLEKNKIFLDCLHLLLSHEPGNELHVVPEVSVPGGNVDYFLTSVRDAKVVDFVGIELQTMDTTGTVWPARQSFLSRVEGANVREDRATYGTYGMNWKMTAKTTLIQLHHKIQTFEAINRHLVLVTQDSLLAYLQKNFAFDHIGAAKTGNSMHFHAYRFQERKGAYFISLASRSSTDAEGVGICLGLKAEPKVEIGRIISQLETKLSEQTLLQIP